ncbi:helix-turn-helix domain-containing protein [Ornithinibacillus sp. L9]|uniref:Helix-turn-helix domain-containing protein n=1 Tax=Ornithinibacillus caprae TaxID=2678566 RepID=A0A6N8FK82_9BACI|nr:helix-turn-helix transcriptional regulator [Ornithinibacillus caprae]MUK89116.1 helix-turn-helix domain-containing protein [Ornithinibacillus caprae]
MFAKRLRYIRKLRQLSQEELGKKINSTKSTISNYENEYSTPSNDVLRDLANVLDTTTDYLLGRSDAPNRSEEESFQEFINDPDLQRWYKELPKSKEEDLRRLRKIWEAFKEED